MLSNTSKRIISAIVLMIIVAACLYSGKIATTLLVIVVGTLMNDEVLVNFFRGKRFSASYLLIQVSYLLLFFLLLKYPAWQWSFCCLGIFLNIFLLWYLFTPAPNKGFIDSIQKYQFPLVSFFTLIPMISIVYIMSFDYWRLIIFLLLVVNFGMDSGAWFFGKILGRHKLWPEVSPNKTIEGLLGGMLTAGLCGYAIFLVLLSKNVYWVIAIFALLGLLSQIGDLVQSKLKRQFGIKDSSSLIPGHGGVYDRIDSLVFVLPFFVVTLYYYY